MTFFLNTEIAAAKNWNREINGRCNCAFAEIVFLQCPCMFPASGTESRVSEWCHKAAGETFTLILIADLFLFGNYRQHSIKTNIVNKPFKESKAMICKQNNQATRSRFATGRWLNVKSFALLVSLSVKNCSCQFTFKKLSWYLGRLAYLFVTTVMLIPNHSINTYTANS